MTEDKIKNLLQQADMAAGELNSFQVDISTIRRRAGRKKVIMMVMPLASAAMLMVALSIFTIMFRTTEPKQQQRKIALLESQIKQLQARTNAALSLVQEVLEDEQRQHRLNELRAQLASIPDPIGEMENQMDKTAFILLNQADRLYNELNQTDSAVENYKRVIKLFPDNRWAKVAKQRLSEIKNLKTDKTI